MTIAQEEIFGPVLCIIPYDDEEDAIRIANDTHLRPRRAASGPTDPERAKRVARRIRTGQVDINGGSFNPIAPFGGYKQSGHGREFGKLRPRGVPRDQVAAALSSERERPDDAGKPWRRCGSRPLRRRDRGSVQHLPVRKAGAAGGARYYIVDALATSAAGVRDRHSAP